MAAEPATPDPPMDQCEFLLKLPVAGFCTGALALSQIQVLGFFLVVVGVILFIAIDDTSTVASYTAKVVGSPFPLKVAMILSGVICLTCVLYLFTMVKGILNYSPLALTINLVISFAFFMFDLQHGLSSASFEVGALGLFLSILAIVAVAQGTLGKQCRSKI